MSGRCPPVIDIHGLWTVLPRAGGQTVVHRDLELSVQAGELLSVVGGSGTGKTLLLRQILGLEQPTRGRIEVLGEPAESLREQGFNGQLGNEYDRNLNQANVVASATESK